MREIVETLAIALILALVIRTFVLQAFYIPSSSMENTLFPRDRILVNKYIYSMRPVRRGDIIVFKAPQTPERDFIKRCVGIGGDVVEVCDKGLYVNGNKFVDPPGVVFKETAHVPPAAQPGNRDNMKPFTVPSKGAVIGLNEANIEVYGDVIEYEGHVCRTDNDGTIRIDGVPAVSYTFSMDHFFMMGDNRDNSQDSRFWRSLPASHVKGKAIGVYWPFSRIGFIH